MAPVGGIRDPLGTCSSFCFNLLKYILVLRKNDPLKAKNTLALSTLQTKPETVANSIDPDAMAHN